MDYRLKCECGSNGFVEVIKSAWALKEDGTRLQQTPEREIHEGIFCVKCGRPAQRIKNEDPDEVTDDTQTDLYGDRT